MECESSSSLQLIEDNVVTEMANVVGVDEPKVGMMFESYKQLLEYYTDYDKQLRFPVKIRSSTKGDDGELKYVTIVCSRSGKSKSTSKNPLKPHPSIKVGCKAKDCRPSESDAIGLVGGQPTSEAIDGMHPVPCSSSKEMVDISELPITSSTSTSNGKYGKEEDRLVLQEEDCSILCSLCVTCPSDMISSCVGW
ncbi:unnamed protein product [Ilex paraguariensis]|uniref:FAR1 domain-containing protein n=1 Tax=Ilex paraguariensis TaxID=185542 RepID=A0ABC8R784_9AQUA